MKRLLFCSLVFFTSIANANTQDLIATWVRHHFYISPGQTMVLMDSLGGIPCVSYFEPSKHEVIISFGRKFSVAINQNPITSLNDQELYRLLVEQTDSAQMNSFLEYGESITQMQTNLESYGITPFGRNSINLALIDDNNGATIEVSCFSKTEVNLQTALASLVRSGYIEFVDNVVD